VGTVTALSAACSATEARILKAAVPVVKSHLMIFGKYFLRMGQGGCPYVISQGFVSGVTW
jgi:hypothetical protein